jgi:DNA-binding beta-propeller fold protein YncE
MQNGPQNGANGLGFWGAAGITMDPVNHHLFVADNSDNNRILVYTLNTDNSIPTASGGHTASYVLGATGLPSNVGDFLCTPSTFNGGAAGLDFDAANGRLFVSDGDRVLIFDNMSTISNGMAASYVLGESSLTNCTDNGFTQSTFENAFGVAYDPVNQRLFVTDDSGSRVLVFNVPTGTNLNGENASYVLGQSSFTASGTGTTSTTFHFDGEALAFDAVNQRLFVADTGNNRVMVFNVAPGSISNGEAASYELGQADFTSNCCQYSGFTQSTVDFPGGITYDATSSRLFVYRGGASSLVVFNVGPSVIQNNENASFVLGSSSFTSSPGGVSQSTFDSGNINTFLYYDPGSQRLFLSDTNNNRVLIFDVSPMGAWSPGYE